MSYFQDFLDYTLRCPLCQGEMDFHILNEKGLGRYALVGQIPGQFAIEVRIPSLERDKTIPYWLRYHLNTANNYFTIDYIDRGKKSLDQISLPYVMQELKRIKVVRKCTQQSHYDYSAMVDFSSDNRGLYLFAAPQEKCIFDINTTNYMLDIIDRITTAQITTIENKEKISRTIVLPDILSPATQSIEVIASRLNTLGFFF